MSANQSVERRSLTAAQTATYFGGRTYAGLLPDMNRALVGTASNEFAVASPAATAALGLVMGKIGRPQEELKEATFSVRASDMTPNFKVVRYGSDWRGVYSYQAQTQDPNKLISTSSSVFEFSLRRENGRDYYTVKTKKGFVGAINVETTEGAFTIYSHGDVSDPDSAGAPERRPLGTASAPASAPASTPATRRDGPSAPRFDPRLTATRTPRPDPETSNTRDLARESMPLRAPSSLGIDSKTADLSLSTLLPAAESLQITLAEPQTTDTPHRPAPANLSIPGHEPAPERREEPRIGGTQFARSPRLDHPEQRTDEPVERPKRPPIGPIELKLDRIPMPPLPGPGEVPMLATLEPETLEVRITPAAPMSPIPLPDALEPQRQPPPTALGFRRSPPREPDMTRDTPPEPPRRQRQRQPQLSFSPPQIPLPDSPHETPQLTVISEQHPPLSRRPAPADITLPAMPSAPERKEQLAESPPRSPRSERNEVPPTEIQQARMERRNTGTPRPSTTAPVPPPEKKKEEPQTDPLDAELAEARRALANTWNRWEAAQNDLLQELGSTPQARKALDTLASQQVEYSKLPQERWLDGRDFNSKLMVGSLVKNAGLSTLPKIRLMERSVQELLGMQRNMAELKRHIDKLQEQTTRDKSSRAQ